MVYLWCGWPSTRGKGVGIFVGSFSTALSVLALATIASFLGITFIMQNLTEAPNAVFQRSLIDVPMCGSALTAMTPPRLLLVCWTDTQHGTATVAADPSEGLASRRRERFAASVNNNPWRDLGGAP